MAVTGKISASLSINQTAAGDLDTAVSTLTQLASVILTDGTGINQVNKVWSDTRTLASASENLDLSGSLTNIYGAAVVFTAIKFMFIHNITALGISTLDVTPGTTNGWSTWGTGSGTGITLPSCYSETSPGSFVLLANCSAAGNAVTAGTGDILKIAANDGTITYNIVLIGK